MLGKLLKHEWKAVTKVMLPANLVLIAITIIGRIMLSAGILETKNEFVGILAGFATTLYILCLLAVSLLCTVFLGYRFYKTVYTDEGYLLHTLPVTSHEIIISKTIAGAVWTLITSLMLFASVIMLVFGTIPAGEWSNVSRELSVGIQNFMGGRFAAWCIFLFFTMILSSIYSLLMLFAGISFGQFFPKHKVVGAFVGYALIYFVIQIITFIVMFMGNIVGLANKMSNGGAEAIIHYMETVFLMSFGISAVFTVLFYLFTNYMMQKKLNLD